MGRRKRLLTKTNIRAFNKLINSDYQKTEEPDIDVLEYEKQFNIKLNSSEKFDAILGGLMMIGLSLVFVCISLLIIIKMEVAPPGILLIFLACSFFIWGICLIPQGINKAKKLKILDELISRSSIEEVDEMQGADFEYFLCTVFQKLGYQTTQTKASGDYGADLILEKENERIAVQAKRYAKKVSISAVQEVVGAINQYNCQTAWVITNNYFTKPAMELAKANNVTLIDRNELSKIMVQAQSKIEEKEEKSA